MDVIGYLLLVMDLPVVALVLYVVLEELLYRTHANAWVLEPAKTPVALVNSRVSKNQAGPQSKTEATFSMRHAA